MKTIRLILISLIVLSLTTAWTTAAWVSVITKETIKNWMARSDVIILDARQGRDWSASESKIKGAIRVDPERLETWKSRFSKHQKIVLYCAGPDEDTSAGLAQQLAEDGFTDVHALRGGWQEWFRAKYPVEKR